MKNLKVVISSLLVLTLLLSTWIYGPASATTITSDTDEFTFEGNVEFVPEISNEVETETFEFNTYGKELAGVGESYTSGDFTYTLNEDNTAVITGYSNTGVTSLTIPSVLDNYTVTNIGDYAFSNFSQLKSVTLPDTIHTIGRRSFEKCTALTDMVFPEGLTGITDGAFNGCTALESVFIPKSLVSTYGYLDAIAYGGPFRNCTKLTTVLFAEGVHTIPAFLFIDCTALTSVVLPDTVKTIGDGAFKNCINLKQIIIPDGVTVLERQTFANCYALTDVTLPKKLTAITDGTFNSCTSLKSINIPKSLVSVNGYPDGYAYGGAFKGCTNLTSITFEDGVHTIPGCLFIDCEALTSIDIPSTVTEIGSGAFKNCTNLKKIVIPDGVTTIEGSTFANCYSLSEITLPANLKYLNDNSFVNCTGLKSITIPKTIQKVNGFPDSYGGAFNGCTNLETVTFEDGLEIIPDCLLKDCTGLKAVVIPASVTKVDTGAFKNCPVLERVYVTGQNTYIAFDAFRGNSIVEIYCPKYSKTHMNLIDVGLNVFPFDDVRHEETAAIVDTQSYFTAKSGSKVSFTCDYTIKDEVFENLFDMFVTIKIPTESSVSEQSMYLDRTKLTDYTEEDGLINIPIVNKSGTITFDLLINSSTQLRAYAVFNYTLKESLASDVDFVEKNGIYVCADNGWIPFCYAWTASDRNEMWPGIKMTHIKDDIYGFTGTKTYENVVFNNSNSGDENKTKDLINPGSGYIYNISTDEWSQLARFTEGFDIINVINEDMPFVTINAPTVTATERFSISGAAPADKTINFYIDNVDVAVVRSNKAGNYVVDISLPDAKKNKIYTIKAVTTDENGNEILSECKVRYNDSTPTLTEFTMDYNGSTYNMLESRKQSIIFRLESFHGQTPFKFIVKLDKPELADSVFITSTRSGVSKYMTATWSDEENAYVAEGYFDENNHDYVPGKINVHFTEKKEKTPVNETWVNEQLNGDIPEAFSDAKLTMVKESDDEKIMTVALSDENIITYTIKRYPLDSFVDNLESDVSDEGSSTKIEVASVGSIEDIRKEAIFEENAETAKLIAKYGWEIVSGADNVFCTKQETTPTEIINYVIDTSREYVYSEVISFVNDSFKEQFLDLIQDEYSRELVDTSFTIGSGLYTGGGHIAQWGNDSVNLLTARYAIISNPNLTQSQKEYRLSQLQEYQDKANSLMVVKVMGCMFKTISSSGLVDPSTAFTFWAIGFALEDVVPYVIENEEDIRMKIESTHTYKFLAWVFDISWIIDPSGFVYEGVTSNRIEDAKVTAYWIPYDETSADFWNQTPDSSNKLIWDAEKYSQINPLYTDVDGNYSWDVPEGWWKVVCEKDGYETFETEWLPVPPPQTEVNINLKSKATPEVDSFWVSTNSLEVVFSHYMNPASIEDITLTDSNGSVVDFIVNYDKSETDAEGNVFAKRFTFTPIGYNEGDCESFAISISEMETYAGVKLQNVSMEFEITFESTTVNPDASEPTQPEEGTTAPGTSEPEVNPSEPESSTPTEPEATYLIGDANGDGKINVKDATQIQKAAAALVTLDDVQTLASDANGDEKVNVKDATAIQKFVAGIPVNFPIGEERKK